MQSRNGANYSGVGPPTTVENHSPPSAPVRPSSTASHSVSASFQRPTYKRRPTEVLSVAAAESAVTEHSAAATDVWYFC
jgi:hypothetical protein